MSTLEARIADVLAYQHCRVTNPKADHPIFGYHAFSEDQRDFLRSRMMPEAGAVAAMLAPAIREAQAEALREAADLLAPKGILWWGDSGVRVSDGPFGMPQGSLDDWLRARADNLEAPNASNP